MSTINEYFQQSELSLAAYANLIAGKPSQADLIGAGMSLKQAEHFAATYRVVDQWNNNSIGLSATVFELLDANGNPTGQQTLAIRGTEPATPTDLLTGAIDIYALGSTLVQPQHLDLKWKVQQWLDSGDLSSSFTVTGHSLGGFLATAITADYPNNVSHAYLYNAPGIGGLLGIGSVLAEISNALGITTPPEPPKFSALKAEAGISPIAGLGQPISSPIPIVIEDQTASDVTGGPGAMNHSQVVLADALAVYNLYDQFAPGLGIEGISKIIKAESNKHSTTLENSLDALRELLTGVALDANTRTPVGDRNVFYTNLYALQPQLAALTGNETIVTLAGVSGAEMAASAQSSGSAAMAYRYALLKGNAFAVVGNDALYTQHNANGELNLYDPATHTGDITTEYLKQRADFMERKLYYNTQNTSYNIWSPGGIPANGNDPYAGQDIQWEDRSTGDVMQRVGQVTDNTTRVIFGGQGIDTINGANKADALFGGAGDDTLTGNKGNDYLEGGKGNDTYIYINGGTNQDGLDTILDTDGNGTIQIDGNVIAGGDQYGDNRVHRDANGHLYTDVGSVGSSVNGMIIDGNIFVQNWQAGNLGINMSGPAAQTNPQTSHTFIGDHPMHTATIVPGSQDAGWRVVGSPYNQQYTTVDNGNGGTTNVLTAYDVDYYLIDTATGNTIEGGGPVRTDTFTDTAANDHILGGGGNDTLNANKGGDDILEGQAGNDYIEAGAGYDVLIGGAGNDILNGGAGDDRLYADTQQDAATAIAQGNAQTGSGSTGDWLNAGTGEDTLVGGNANDLLAGGAGADLLIGGAGDDVIVGDNDTLPSNFPNRTWHPVDYNTSIFLESVRYNTPPAPDTSGNDVIYAGEGNDFAFGDYGNDVILGEKGNDHLFGNSGNDVLLGGDGNDHLYGDSRENYAATPAPGNDYLDGGAGDDHLIGNEGDDILSGGTDNDMLAGGAGQDTYIYNVGDGIDHIFDNTADRNILRFGAGVDSRNIKLHLGSLLLDLGNGDAVHIENFNQGDVFNSSSISGFEFADVLFGRSKREAANDVRYEVSKRRAA